MVVKQTRRRRRGASIEPAPAAQQPQQQVINCGHSFHQDEQSKGDPKLVANASLLDHVVEFDRKFSAWVHEHGLGIFFYVFLRTLEFSGDGVFLIPCAAATFLAPKSKLTPELRMFFFNLFMAFLFDLIFVSIIKKIVRRPRPVYNRGHFKTIQVDHWSFPSGHSTRALLVVTMFGLYIPMWKDQSHRIWLPYLQKMLMGRIEILTAFVPTAETILISLIGSTVTCWAIATTSSRIILGRHFFCDVVAGSLLGIFEAFFAHYFLAIPIGTSEAIHTKINGAFGKIENATWQMFHGTNPLAAMHILGKR